MATSAATEKNATPSRWPGRIASAASSGPSAPPIDPPTWNIDCASPRRGPAARCATRELSGWKVEDPTPTSAAAASSSG